MSIPRPLPRLCLATCATVFFGFALLEAPPALAAPETERELKLVSVPPRTVLVKECQVDGRRYKLELTLRDHEKLTFEFGPLSVPATVVELTKTPLSAGDAADKDEEPLAEPVVILRSIEEWVHGERDAYCGAAVVDEAEGLIYLASSAGVNFNVVCLRLDAKPLSDENGAYQLKQVRRLRDDADDAEIEQMVWESAGIRRVTRSPKGHFIDSVEGLSLDKKGPMLTITVHVLWDRPRRLKYEYSLAEKRLTRTAQPRWRELKEPY